MSPGVLEVTGAATTDGNGEGNGGTVTDEHRALGMTEVPAYGDDGNEYSAGYLNSGDIPTFRIYDASEDMIFDIIEKHIKNKITKNTKKNY